MRENLENSFFTDCILHKRLYARSGAVTTSSFAATMAELAGKITTESMSTAAGSSQNVTITNPNVEATDMIFVHRQGGTNTTGTEILRTLAGAGSYVITFQNNHASAAFNGTFIVAVLIVKAAVGGA